MLCLNFEVYEEERKLFEVYESQSHDIGVDNAKKTSISTKNYKTQAKSINQFLDKMR